MVEFIIPLKLIRLVQITLEEVNSKVHIQTNLSREFEFNIGLSKTRRCLILSIVYTALEKVVRDSGLQR